MKKLSMPGVYLDETNNQLVVDVVELLRWAGWEDTPENRDKVTAIANKACAQALPGVQRAVLTKDPESTRRALEAEGVEGVEIIERERR